MLKGASHATMPAMVCTHVNHHVGNLHVGDRTGDCARGEVGVEVEKVGMIPYSITIRTIPAKTHKSSVYTEHS